MVVEVLSDMAADVKDVHRTVSMSQVSQQWSSRYNKYFSYIRDIRKVRKRQGENPEFGHTWVEIQKKPAKKYISIQGGAETQKIINFYGFTVSFFFPERVHWCYIDFHCSYLYIYYNLSRALCIKCWDSAFRTQFQHFILRFPYFADTTKRGVRGWKTGWLYGYLYYDMYY